MKTWNRWITCVAGGTGLALGMVACAEPTTTAPTDAAPGAAPAARADAGESAQPPRPAVERTRDGFRAGTARINTPLPEGYPDPTAPGAIEIKTYPVVRRAMVSGERAMNAGMNSAFWPLFRHIQRRDIEMTSPVEMDYQGLTSTPGDNPESWTMSFLYRTTNQGPVGTDTKSPGGVVTVEDLPAMEVAAIGFQGPYRIEVVKMNLARLEAWLAAQPEWERAGEPRALFYNGPEQRESRKWGEVQVPIRRVAPAAAEGAPTPPTSPAPTSSTPAAEGRG